MKNSQTGPKPPKTLSREARALWAVYCHEYVFDEHGLVVLGQALESFDRLRQAQELLTAEGIVQTDRFGQKKPHPAVVIERDARASMLRALGQLHIDVEPLHDGPGRPGGSRAN